MIAKLSTSFSNPLNLLGLQLDLRKKNLESKNERMVLRNQTLIFKIERSFRLREILRNQISRSFFKTQRMALKNQTLIFKIE
jgi:hypothetical protein